MASPRFTFRLPEKDLEALRDMAVLYGAPSVGGFLAEMVGCMCSGDLDRVKAFNGRLIVKAGEQLSLSLNAALDAASVPAKAQKPAKVAAKPVKRVKGRAKRAKSS